MLAALILAATLQLPPAPQPAWHWASTPAGLRQIWGHLRDGRVYPAPMSGPVLGPRPVTITLPMPAGWGYGTCAGGTCRP